jgi:hypothetical protein
MRPAADAREAPGSDSPLQMGPFANSEARCAGRPVRLHQASLT